MSGFIEIVEVGARDGLQNEKAVLEAADKIEFIRRLEACGARRIEAVSFVNERRVPQMAGAEAIMAALPHAEGRSRIGLVLNERGWDRALATVVARQKVEGGPPISVTFSVAFGCPFDGEVSEDQIVALAREAGALGVP